MSAQDVLFAHRQAIEAIPGVLGTALSTCRGEFCIVVYASQENISLVQTLPSELAGYRLIVRQSGVAETQGGLDENSVAVRSVSAVIAQYREELRRNPIVIGTGVAQCGSRACIKIYVSELNEHAKSLPAQLDGYDVILQHSVLQPAPFIRQRPLGPGMRP